MRILFLAPQPFYQERGTPIAVRLALGVLTQSRKHNIELLTYHEGADLTLPDVQHTRIPIPQVLKGWLVGIGPGISLKKLVCDILFTYTALALVVRNRTSDSRFQIVHAVEEGVFVAWIIKHLFGLPYIYDMDSSLAVQLSDKWWWLKPIKPIMEWFERLAIRGSDAVVPVCDALAILASKHGARDQETVRDISLLEVPETTGPTPPSDTEPNLRAEAGFDQSKIVLLYVGNLEPYQGMDLLIESFEIAASQIPELVGVVIGGSAAHIGQFSSKVARLGLSDRFKFIGPRPVADLKWYLGQADILCSPRVKGNNTPMKIFSYLHSGRVVVATDLPTHRQVLDETISVLAAATPDCFGMALARVAKDSSLRERIGSAAFKHAEERYTFPVFSQSLSGLYARVEARRQNS